MSNKKEIETKIRIDNVNVFERIKNKIEAEGIKVEEVYQHDVYYSPEKSNYMNEKYPYKWLRLRYLDSVRAEVCFKHFYPEREEKHIFCNEYQSVVSDPKAIVNIFSELDLKVIADVEKYRSTYILNRYLFSFDRVNNLGDFIEIELKDIQFDELKERELLEIVIRKLGLSTFPVDLRGYPFLIYNKSRKN